MCSINFILTSSSWDLKNSIKKMSLTSLSRGPDEQTLLCKKNWAMAFNRLSIVGGKKGTQPIFNEDKSLALICNGEIFNYKELRARFLRKHIFSTTSDAEVIIHLYEKYKEKCVDFLEGQFSFIIYNLKNKEVFVARDKFGILPLYISFQKKSLLISSSIFSILASRLVEDRKIDEVSVAEILFFYGSRSTRSPVKQILQLPSASYALIRNKSKTLVYTHYWHFQENLNEKGSLRKILKDSVLRRIGNGKFGIYISGGVDSAIIAFLASKISKNKPHLFSLAFDNKTFDESRYQKLLANYLNCRWTKITVGNSLIVNNFHKALKHLESPVSRLASVPLILLSDAVNREGIKYVLCGEGADELFLGYPVFETRKASYESKWDENLKYLSVFKSKSILKMLKRERENLDKQFGTDGSVPSLRKKEMVTKLTSYLLSSQGDRVSMAHSIEQRFPYLDENLWDYAVNLGEKELFDKQGGKAILRSTFKNDLPLEILERKKQGYLVPDMEIVRLMLKKKKFIKLLKRDSIEKANVFEFREVKNIVKTVKNTQDKQAASILILIISTQLFFKEINKL